MTLYFRGSEWPLEDFVWQRKLAPHQSAIHRLRTAQTPFCKHWWEKGDELAVGYGSSPSTFTKLF